jgi:hypothetical protein
LGNRVGGISGRCGGAAKSLPAEFVEGLNRTLKIGTGMAPVSKKFLDRNVWCGRALQETFVDLSACGLASMYPASD